MTRPHRRLLPFCIALLTVAVSAWAELAFPPPEFRSGYQLPETQQVLPQGAYRDSLDVGVLVVCLALATWFAVGKRSRRGLFWLTLIALGYFGFYRAGCVCAVGSVQNVAAAAFGTQIGLPWIVGAFFALPLVAALFFGRVFCSSVCPLGAVQDVVLFKPVQVPAWLEAGLGLLAHVYLAAAVVYAAAGSEFLICSYDPFVGFFRLSGSIGMLLLGAGLLLASMFVGRIYCRFLCPYSVLLRSFSGFAKWPVHVSPSVCISCHLCQEACPYGALDRPRPGVAGQSRRRQTVLAVAAGLIAIGVGAWAGSAGRDLWARLDRTVQLARGVQAAQQGETSIDIADTLTAWEKTGERPEDLYARANAVTARLGTGAAWAGAWLGSVVALRLLRFGRGLPRTIYDANAGTCLACARCFVSCPVELERRGLISNSGNGVSLNVLPGAVA